MNSDHKPGQPASHSSDGHPKVAELLVQVAAAAGSALRSMAADTQQTWAQARRSVGERKALAADRAEREHERRQRERTAAAAQSPQEILAALRTATAAHCGRQQPVPGVDKVIDAELA
ncbi:MAG: hypothetical protein FJ100_23065 [Deltaproteobacteria bacterium]|nr:hypothetical protein [Deltaproteobacteria bacterium]